MAEKGLPQVTAREVAERAGLNPGLVRYYFGGKEGLLRAVVDQVAAEGKVRTDHWATERGDPRSRMRGLIAAMIQGFFEDPYSPRLLFEQVVFADEDVVDQFVEDFARSHIDVLSKLIADGQRSGDFRAGDPDLLISAISGACIFLFLGAPLFDRIFDRTTLTPERVDQYTDLVTKMVLDGITRTGAGA